MTGNFQDCWQRDDSSYEADFSDFRIAFGWPPIVLFFPAILSGGKTGSQVKPIGITGVSASHILRRNI